MCLRERNKLTEIASTMQALFRLISIVLIGLSYSSAALAESITADGLRDTYERVVRVRTIARQIFASNLEVCPIKHSDFGFTAVSSDFNASASVRSAWADWLGPGDGMSVIAVYASGPAMTAGLRVGDRIIESNGRKLRTDVDLKSFAQSLAEVQDLTIVASRDLKELRIKVSAQEICAGSLFLTSRPDVNAFAQGMSIFVDGGMEKLLTSDDELAWIIAHEAAHLFLGHTGPDRSADSKKRQARKVMEQEADALSVRLMLRAGFAPEASADAQLKMAESMRGPISRLLDLSGSYMRPQDRAHFLTSETKAARYEQNKSKNLN
jgi:hypothetical protein